jgi:hypothetical protein
MRVIDARAVRWRTIQPRRRDGGFRKHDRITLDPREPSAITREMSDALWDCAQDGEGPDAIYSQPELPSYPVHLTVEDGLVVVVGAKMRLILGGDEIGLPARPGNPLGLEPLTVIVTALNEWRSKFTRYPRSTMGLLTHTPRGKKRIMPHLPTDEAEPSAEAVADLERSLGETTRKSGAKSHGLMFCLTGGHLTRKDEAGLVLFREMQELPEDSDEMADAIHAAIIERAESFRVAGRAKTGALSLRASQVYLALTKELLARGNVSIPCSSGDLAKLVGYESTHDLNSDSMRFFVELADELPKWRIDLALSNPNPKKVRKGKAVAQRVPVFVVEGEGLDKDGKPVTRRLRLGEKIFKLSMKGHTTVAPKSLVTVDLERSEWCAKVMAALSQRVSRDHRKVRQARDAGKDYRVAHSQEALLRMAGLLPTLDEAQEIERKRGKRGASSLCHLLRRALDEAVAAGELKDWKVREKPDPMLDRYEITLTADQVRMVLAKLDAARAAKKAKKAGVK